MEGWRSGPLGAVVGMRSDWRRESRASACASASMLGWSLVLLRRALSSAAASSASAAARLLGLKDPLAALSCDMGIFRSVFVVTQQCKATQSRIEESQPMAALPGAACILSSFLSEVPSHKAGIMFV